LLRPRGGGARREQRARRRRRPDRTRPSWAIRSWAWNQFLLDLQATPGDQPATVHPTYELAMVHTAIHDAVVSIDHSDRRYLVGVRAEQGASVAAAADAAAHDTLVQALSGPAGRDRPAVRGAARARPRPSTGRREVRLGRQIAAKLSALRADDGSTAPPVPFQPGTNAGDYQLTPPALAAPVFTQWSHVKPFLLRRATSSGRPPPRAGRARSTRRRSNEVKALGSRHRLDAHARPDADRPVLEPADLGGLEPHRAGPSRVAHHAACRRRAHVRSAQRPSPTR
jgi:hypothetical protein